MLLDTVLRRASRAVAKVLVSFACSPGVLLFAALLASLEVTMLGAEIVPAIHVGSVKDQADTVSGSATNIRYVRVKVFDSDGRELQHSDAVVDPADSSFVAGLRSVLREGQIVEIRSLADGVETATSNLRLVTKSAPVENAQEGIGAAKRPASSQQSATSDSNRVVANQAGPSSSNTASTSSPLAIYDPVEGDSSIQGYVPPGASNPTLTIKQGSTILQIAPLTIDNTNNFTFKPRQVLASGQELVLSATANGQPTTAPPVMVSPADYDWGKVRSYFTLGLVLSQQGNDFSLNSANPFLDFTFLKDWHWWQYPEQLGPNSERGWGGFRLSSYFDARLTAIGTSAIVSSNSGPSSPVGTGNQSQNTSAGQNSNSNSGAGISTVAPQSVLINRQAASLQAGVYLPLVVERYNYKGANYSLFIAPLLKTGFYTPTSSNSVGNSLNTAQALPVTSSRFFPFYGYGLRIGHSEDSNSAPKQTSTSDLLSYVDFTVGRYGNFEYTSSGCLLANGACLRQRLMRYGIEGILKIPHTPLIIGMSANLAAQRSHMPGFTAPQDDLRFLFGAKFDARRLVEGLLSKGGN